ncbi:MAG: RNA polymerase sigma factor [Phycisphaerales bacterium]
MATPDAESSRQLLIRCRRGDEAAALALWNLLGPPLIAYARSITRRQHLAEDIVQQVFGEVLALPQPAVAAIRDPAAWLTLATRRRAANALRAQHRRERAERHSARPPRPQTRGNALDDLERLGWREREVLVLRHTLGLSFPQIALTLGIATSTAAARYEHALRTLRELVSKTEVLHG